MQQGRPPFLVSLAMVDGVGPGYITAGRCSSLTAGPQTKASRNHGTSTPIANLGVVPVEPDGSLCIYNQTAVHLIVDLQGAFAASGALRFFPIVPVRIFDSR